MSYKVSVLTQGTKDTIQKPSEELCGELLEGIGVHMGDKRNASKTLWRVVC